MSMRAIYTHAMRKQLGAVFGNWEPGAPIALGDYGFQVGGAFERIGSIRSFGVKWSTLSSPGGDTHRKFTSSKGVTVAFKAKGNAPAAKAALTVNFGSKSAVFADFAGCTYSAMSDKRLVGEQLLQVGQFDRRWVVVTDAIQAKRSIIAISASSNASVTFEAKAEVQSIDLADAEIELKAGKQTSIGYLIDAEHGLTPIVGICGFRDRFLTEALDFRTRSAEQALAPEEPTSFGDPVFLQFS